jgi:MFS family permease
VTFGRRLFLVSLVVSLSLTAALAIGTLLFGDFDENGGNLVVTTAFLSLASLLALPAGVLLDHDRAPLLAWTVILATATAFVLAELALWADGEETEWKLALTFGLIALAGAQAAATTWPFSADDGVAVMCLYWFGIGLSVALAALISAAVWSESGDDEGARVIAATAVAALLATLLQPIVRRLRQPARRTHELVLRLDTAPADAAVAAAVEALARHGVKADVVSRPRV